MKTRRDTLIEAQVKLRLVRSLYTEVIAAVGTHMDRESVRDVGEKLEGLEFTLAALVRAAR